MPVKHIHSVSELQGVVAKAPTCVKATASWCPPCRQIAPVYEALSNKYIGTACTEFDVDEAKEVGEHLGIKAMPTFVFFKDGVEVDRLQGADPGALEEKLKALGGGAFSGSGHRLGDVPSVSTTSTSSSATAKNTNQNQNQNQNENNEGMFVARDRPWPLTVPEGAQTGKIALQNPDGSKIPLKIAPEVHTVKDLYVAIGQMYGSNPGSFSLSVREGMKPVVLDSGSSSTLKEAHCSGAIVILKNL